MRKLALVITAVSVVVAASFVSPLGALASTSTRSPAVPVPHSGARTSLSPVHVPSTRLPSTSTSVSTVNCDAGFHFVGSPNGSGANFLVATAAISANDVWAVGNSTSAGGLDQTLAEHWNGTSWSIVPTPNPSSGNNDLNGVAAIATNDVWAVGDFFAANFTTFSIFVEHWDGSNWIETTITSPSSISLLLGVTAISSTNVWAVGRSSTAPRS